MRPGSGKRKRSDLEESFSDNSSESSESGTSGSSFKPSDSDEDTDSSIDNSDVVSVTAPKGVKKVTSKDLERIPSTRKVKKVKMSVESGEVQSDQEGKRMGCAAGSLPIERSHENKDILGHMQSFTVYNKKVIERACKRLREGATSRTVADELGIREITVGSWRSKYLSEDERKEINAQRLSNNKKRLEACKLMKKGAKTNSLAKRFGVSRNTIVYWRNQVAPETVQANHEKHTILEACRKLKKASVKAVALKTGIKIKTLSHWKRKYLLTKIKETTSEGSWEYDEYTKLEACYRLNQGQRLETVAEALDVHISVLQKWEREINTLEIITQPEDGKVYDKNFILDVCKRLVEGQSAVSIAKSLGVSSSQVNIWKRKYCSSGSRETSDGRKYGKETINRACELLKSGDNVSTVAKKLRVSVYTVNIWKRKYASETNTKPEVFHSYETVVKFLRNNRYKKRRNVLEAYKLLKQGQRMKTIARKLKVAPEDISLWRLDYMVKGKNLKDTTEYPNNIVQQAFKGFKQGDALSNISVKCGIKTRTVNYWHYQYLEQVHSKFMQKMSSIGEIDDKLKSEPMVLLRKDQEIDNLGQKHNFSSKLQPLVAVDKATIERACQRFREGASARTVAKEFGTTVNRVVLWRSRNLSKEERVLRKCFKVTNEQISEACRLMKQGSKKSALAKRFGVREETIEIWRNKYISDTSRLLDRTSRFDVETILKVCRQLNSGDSVRTVSRRMGIAAVTVRKWKWKYLLAKTQESTPEGSWEFIKYKKLQAYQKIKKGIATEAIAKELNVDFDLVRKWELESAKDGIHFDRKAKEEVLERLKRGERVPAISKDLGLPYMTVYGFRRYQLQKKVLKQQGQNVRKNISSRSRNSDFKRVHQVQQFLKTGGVSKGRNSASLFIPFRKVHIPYRMKLKFIEMIDSGVSIEKLSKELKVNELTLKSWILNRDLLARNRARSNKELLN